jgi:energy-coupling factor transport system ATP-binding protein
MAALIEVRHVYYTYRYPGQEPAPALQDVSLTIDSGKFVAIVGRNGSGKSTLAKHFNALLLPEKGDVLVEGLNTKDTSALWTIRQKAGMVFQHPDNQLVATIVEEDVAFGPENLGVPPEEIRRRVGEALNMVGMESYRGHAPHLLSGGQKQRVAIAGVLAMHPKCLVLDEATAMLDPAGREEVMSTIKRLNREEGITVVLITHHMEEAVQADEVVVMGSGKVELVGTPREVFTQVEKVTDAGLDVPQVTRLARLLRQRGLSVNNDIMTVEEMVNSLCRLS